MADIVDTTRHRGEFFTVLQETERSQTAVMTIAPGADAGPEERHEGIRSSTSSRGTPSCGSARPSIGPAPDRA